MYHFDLSVILYFHDFLLFFTCLLIVSLFLSVCTWVSVYFDLTDHLTVCAQIANTFFHLITKPQTPVVYFTVAGFVQIFLPQLLQRPEVFMSGPDELSSSTRHNIRAAHLYNQCHVDINYASRWQNEMRWYTFLSSSLLLQWKLSCSVALSLWR